MDVVQFLRWRRRVPRQRYAVQAAITTAAHGEEEVDGGAEDEDEGEEVEEGQHEAQELQGKLAFDMITSEDIWLQISTLYT